VIASLHRGLRVVAPKRLVDARVSRGGYSSPFRLSLPADMASLLARAKHCVSSALLGATGARGTLLLASRGFANECIIKMNELGNLPGAKKEVRTCHCPSKDKA
jgi:hypothetical protein